MPPAPARLSPEPQLPSVEPPRPHILTFSGQRFNPHMPARAQGPLPRTRANSLEIWPSAVGYNDIHPVALYILSLRLTRGDESNSAQYLWARKFRFAYETFVTRVRMTKRRVKASAIGVGLGSCRQWPQN